LRVGEAWRKVKPGNVAGDLFVFITKVRAKIEEIIS